MKKLTQFNIGVIMCILEAGIFIMQICTGRFNSMIAICLIYWIMWTVYFWNQRGEKCHLKIIPLKKDVIEIGDLVQEIGFPLSGITSGITTCMVPGGKEYSLSAQPIQFVVIVNDKLKLGDTYLDWQTKELKQYTASLLLELSITAKGFEDQYNKKVVLFQKDMPQEFIETVIAGKTRDGDTVIVRKNKVFREKLFFENYLILGIMMLFLCAIIGDLTHSVYVIFDKDNSLGGVLTLIVGMLLIAPVFYQAIKFFLKHYLNKNSLIYKLL